MEEILAPEIGYDFVAEDFDQWKWSKLWTTVEEPLVLEWLNYLPAQSIGIDAGGGTGRYLKPILDRSLSCVVVDISQRMMEQAQKNLKDMPSPRVRWQKADIAQTGLESHSYDWILCARTLTHVQEPESVFREFERLLKPGGACLLTDIHPEHNYECTGIPAKAQKIQIETYKHSLESILAAIGKHPNFKNVELNPVSDSGGDKLLYVLRFVKNT